MGPILFCIYISPLGEIIEEQNLDRQSYADDNGLYTSFAPKHKESKSQMLKRIYKCIEKVRAFLFENKLKVNDDKTIFMLLGSAYWLSHVDFQTIRVGSTDVSAVDDTQNLGVISYKEMTFEKHVNSICKKQYM